MAYTTAQALSNFQSNKWTADQYNKWAAAYSQGNTGFDPTTTSAPISPTVATPVSTPTPVQTKTTTPVSQPIQSTPAYVAPVSTNPVYYNAQPSAGIATTIQPTPTPLPTQSVSQQTSTQEKPPKYAPFTITSNLKYGSRGQEVEDLQTYLQKLQLYDGKIDGIFGNVTLNALAIDSESKS